MRNLLLASTALYRMMADEGAGSAAPASAPAAPSPADGAPAAQQPAPAGGPTAAAPAPSPAPAAAPAVIANGAGQTVQKISRGRIVDVKFKNGIDGDVIASGIVAKVNDDGTVNVRVFNPTGGADQFHTGVPSWADYDAMPDGADKNGVEVAWDWPARV